MMWNIFVTLVFLYLLTGLIDHIINVYKFFFIDSREEDEEDTIQKLIEKK